MPSSGIRWQSLAIGAVLVGAAALGAPAMTGAPGAPSAHRSSVTSAGQMPPAELDSRASPDGNVDHHCADLLVKAQVQLAVVRGVWACLEPAVQALFKGTGDAAVAGDDLYFTGYRFIGCDGSMCVYSLAFEATTAGTSGISQTTMTVWLDGLGLVCHAAIPKPIP